MIHRIGIIISALLYSYSLYAQPACHAIISGRVVNALDTSGVAFANVYLPERESGVVTEIDGSFVLKDVCPGMVNLRVSHISFNTYLKNLRLDGDTTLVIRLAPDGYALSEVDIEAEVQPREYVLSKVEMKNVELVKTSGQSLANTLKTMPGFSVMGAGANIGKPVYHGLHSNRLILFNHGVRQEGQQWGGEHAPEVDVFTAGNLTLVSGMDALRYASDALGGVLLIEAPPLPDSTGVSGSISLIGASNGRSGVVSSSVEGKPFVRLPLSFRVQASAKMGGDVKTPNRYLLNTGERENNLSYALAYKTRIVNAQIYYSNFNQQLAVYRYSHIGNLTDLYNILQGESLPDTTGFSYAINRPYQRVGHELLKATVDFRLAAKGKFSFAYSRQFNRREEYDIHVGYSPGLEKYKLPQLDYKLTTHEVNIDWQHPSFNHWNGSIGVSGMQQGNTFRGRNFMPDYRAYSGGIWWLENYRSPLWHFNLGLRYDHRFYRVFRAQNDEDSEDYHFQGVAGGAAAQRKIGENAEITFSMASLWRAPAINELFSQGLHHGVAAIEQGDSGLKQERAFNLSVGFDYHHANWWVNLKGFSYFFSNFIYLQPTALKLTIRGAFPAFDYRQNDALYAGLDMKTEKTFANIYKASLYASLLWVQNRDQNTFFAMIPPHHFGTVISKTFKDVGSWLTPYIEVNGSYVMKQYREPETLPMYVQNGVLTIGEVPPSFDFAPAPDGYFLLGIETGTGLKIGNQVMRFSLSVQNALNKTYRDYMNRFRYYADEPGTNVVLRIKIPFQFNYSSKNK